MRNNESDSLLVSTCPVDFRFLGMWACRDTSISKCTYMCVCRVFFFFFLDCLFVCLVCVCVCQFSFYGDI